MKIKDKWFHQCRVIDRFNDIIDYYISSKCDDKEAKAFLHKTIVEDGLPGNIVVN
ncbi:MAG: DDE-type integrase/transposase/recombinase [Piscirickettsiaceae bacterium]|nr:DDE-type integrase/transposase/recombinase [Piscirickettsiaceae bacterium]